MTEREGIDPELKRKINKEGFEGDAAVLVGKEEEMENLRERLETGGNTKDLATFIRLHKEILVPSQEFNNDDDDKKWLDTHYNPGSYFIIQNKMCFLDSGGNLAAVAINPDKIDDYKKIGWNSEIIKEDLKKLGFEEEINLYNHTAKAEERYKEKLEALAKKETQKEFNF